MWFLSPLFIEGLLQKALQLIRLPVIGPLPWRHSFVVMHVVSKLFRIFTRAEKQACKQLQRYKAQLFEPASISGLYNPMV